MTRLVLPIIVLSLTGLGSTALADRAIPLHIAIDKGLVNVTVNGRGSSTGDSVQVTVQRGTARALSVEVLPGTVIESTSGDVFLLGNTSWRVRYVRQGQVVVRDAEGVLRTATLFQPEEPAGKESPEKIPVGESLFAHGGRQGGGFKDERARVRCSIVTVGARDWQGAGRHGVPKPASPGKFPGV